MPKNRDKINLNFILLFIPLFILEIIFHFIQFREISLYFLFRIFLFISTFSILMGMIAGKDRKTFNTVNLVFLILLCSYSFVELIFKNFMGDFYSFNTVSDGAMRIAQYALIFLSNAHPSYYLCFLPIFIYSMLAALAHVHDKGLPLFNVLAVLLSVFMFISTIDMEGGYSPLSEAYVRYTNKTFLIDRIGITHFLFRDLATLVYEQEDEIIIEEEPVEEEKEPVIVDNSRIIDDSLWEGIIEEETNENTKKIDTYLINRSITDKNDYTGKYEGYNFIYFMVEAMDYLAIDKDLTPTLYKMYMEGNTFYNHYTPLYSCATGESEFVSYTSLFPYSNLCTPNYVSNNTFYEALPFLFKDRGYTTFALHNWRDEFYDRNRLLLNLGFDYYLDIDDIWQDSSVKHTGGWQSDAMLIEQAIKEIDKTEGSFFCNIITSVMHFPYSDSSYWGDYYLKEVREVHPDWAIDYQRYMSKSMDFDNGLSILLDYLEENGLSDNTVICIYADHRPYWLDYNTVIRYTSWINDRSSDYGIYRSPFIIYDPAEKGEISYNFCSTLDHVPTIANLFGLDYDPRLYMGSDAYSGDQTVIFTDGNWLNKDGIYYALRDNFVTFKDEETDPEIIMKTNSNVKNTIKISSMIFDSNYFAKRQRICTVPK